MDMVINVRKDFVGFRLDYWSRIRVLTQALTFERSGEIY